MNPHHDEYRSVKKTLAYLQAADGIRHRTDGESALLEDISTDTNRVLDLGTGDGRLLALLLLHCPQARGIGIDYSPPMLAAFRKRFANEIRAEAVEHDLALPLPGDLGTFQVIVSSFAIHHLSHERKRSLYEEVYGLLEPGGMFSNLEHVSSPTPSLHARFFEQLGMSPEDEDKSNILLDVETQLEWLRQIGFQNVDCLWKWRELALLVGFKPRS